jgi:hypothetical protein
VSSAQCWPVEWTSKIKMLADRGSGEGLLPISPIAVFLMYPLRASSLGQIYMGINLVHKGSNLITQPYPKGPTMPAPWGEGVDT